MARGDGRGGRGHRPHADDADVLSLDLEIRHGARRRGHPAPRAGRAAASRSAPAAVGARDVRDGAAAGRAVPDASCSASAPPVPPGRTARARTAPRHRCRSRGARASARPARDDGTRGPRRGRDLPRRATSRTRTSPTCLTCGTPLPPGGRRVSLPRPPLGLLVTDGGHDLPGDRATSSSAARPEQAPDVVAGRARPLPLRDAARSTSRVHARLTVRGWTVLLSDDPSANGTFLSRSGAAGPWLPVTRTSSGRRWCTATGCAWASGSSSSTPGGRPSSPRSSGEASGRRDGSDRIARLRVPPGAGPGRAQPGVPGQDAASPRARGGHGRGQGADRWPGPTASTPWPRS